MVVATRVAEISRFAASRGVTKLNNVNGGTRLTSGCEWRSTDAGTATAAEQNRQRQIADSLDMRSRFFDTRRFWPGLRITSFRVLRGWKSCPVQECTTWSAAM